MDEQQINNIGQINTTISNSQNMLPEPKKKWFPLVLKIAGGVAILAVLGAGTALALRAWDPLWSPFRPNPDQELKSMVESMQKITSVRTEADFRMDGVGQASNTFLIAKLTDSSDYSAPQNPKSDGKLTVGLGIQGVQLSGEANYVVSGKELYVKLTSVPTLPILPIDLSSLKGKWIRMTGSSNDSEEISGMLKIIKNFSGNANIMTVKKELPDEKVDGINSYHYVVGIKEEGIREFVEVILTETSSLASSNEQDIQTQVDELAKKIGALEIEYWIGKKDNLFRKSKIEARIVDEASEAVFGLTVGLADFNKPVAVETPGDYISSEELMNDLAPLLEKATK